MAKRYSVASPSTGTGAANVLYAGGGRVGGGGIPKAAPGGFSIDFGLDKMRQKTEDDEKRKYLISGGLDPKAVALMDTQSLDMGVRAMSDDLIKAEEKKSELADAELLGKFFQDIDKAKTGTSGESGVGKGHGEDLGDYGGPGVGKGFDEWFETPAGEVFPENLTETIVDEPDPAEMPDSFFEMPADEAPEKPVDALSSLLQGLPPRLVTKEIAGAVRQAKKDVTPVIKEVDPYKYSFNAIEDDGKGGRFQVYYDKRTGEQIGTKTKLPPNVDWKPIRIYQDGKPGYMFVDGNNPFNWMEKQGERYWDALPEGATFKAPRQDTKKNNPKFTAWLMNHKIHKNLLPWNKEDKKSSEKYTVSYRDWLTLSPKGSEQEKAALEFSETKSGLEMLLGFARQDPGDTGGNEFKEESLKRGLGE